MGEKEAPAREASRHGRHSSARTTRDDEGADDGDDGADADVLEHVDELSRVVPTAMTPCRRDQLRLRSNGEHRSRSMTLRSGRCPLMLNSLPLRTDLAVPRRKSGLGSFPPLTTSQDQARCRCNTQCSPSRFHLALALRRWRLVFLNSCSPMRRGGLPLGPARNTAQL